MTAQLYRLADYRRRDFLDDWFAGMELVGLAQIAVMLGWVEMCCGPVYSGSRRSAAFRSAPPAEALTCGLAAAATPILPRPEG